ncbi:hypothetical protein [Silvibacterium dinghuense]|uniref:Uncharacterized protein n=1 Tax=Silvibacterium dinghuense TaxID=1560006 RepID=A0A4Q1SET9_9BACT|nr:hypothetical protein [Silvibacterium dinghuense]RXS95448.1 hypothetical protein ESZ00_12785 [Silvibacterium dinghuense]
MDFQHSRTSFRSAAPQTGSVLRLSETIITLQKRAEIARKMQFDDKPYLRSAVDITEQNGVQESLEAISIPHAILLTFPSMPSMLKK